MEKPELPVPRSFRSRARRPTWLMARWFEVLAFNGCTKYDGIIWRDLTSLNKAISYGNQHDWVNLYWKMLEAAQYTSVQSLRSMSKEKIGNKIWR